MAQRADAHILQHVAVGVHVHDFPGALLDDPQRRVRLVENDPLPSLPL